MTHIVVTATVLARNLSELLNKVRFQHATLEVMRGKDTVAYVSPAPGGIGYPLAQLDTLFETLPSLPDDDARSFLDDMHRGVATQTVEGDAWAS